MPTRNAEGYIQRHRGYSFNQISKKMKLKTLLLVKLIATLVSIIILIDPWPMNKKKE